MKAHVTMHVTEPTVPLYDATVASQEWSPDELREPLDLEALIAASYHPRARQAASARRTSTRRSTPTKGKPRTRQPRTRT